MTLVVAYLLFSQFNKKKAAAGPGKAATGDTARTPASTFFRMAYFEMDSIENNLELVKEVKAEMAKKEEEYNQSVSKLEIDYRNRYNDIMRNVKTQAEADAVQGRIASLNDWAKGRRNDIDQEYQKFIMTSNLNMSQSIKKYLTEYNKTRNFSYIVVNEPGLYYYKDTAYNITAELIRGMNEEYKNKKK